MMIQMIRWPSMARECGSYAQLLRCTGPAMNSLKKAREKVCTEKDGVKWDPASSDALRGLAKQTDGHGGFVDLRSDMPGGERHRPGPAPRP